MSDTEMMLPQPGNFPRHDGASPSCTKAEFIALSKTRRADTTAALGGASPHVVEATRQSLASHLCKDISEAPKWGNRPLFRQETRACTDLQVSKFVITDLAGTVLRDEQGPEDGGFTLQVAARRLIVTGTFTKPSAKEVDSGGDCHQRTKITYSHEASFFVWTFPRDSINNVGMTTTRGESATVSVTARRKPWVLLVTVLSTVVCFAVGGWYLLFPDSGKRLRALAWFFAGAAAAYYGWQLWSEWHDTVVSAVSEAKSDENVIKISGVDPETMLPVRIDFTIKCDDEDIGNIVDFIEAVTPETTSVASRVPLSEVSGSDSRVVEMGVAK